MQVNERKEAERRARFLSARFEKWALPRIAARLPGWLLPDHLTGLGILAATGIGVTYLLSNRSLEWLHATNLFLVLHWLGDSLDGTLARVRGIERPRYGFYLDHLTDAYSTVVIGIGLGLSPFLLLSVGLTIVIAYLVLSVNVYLETHVLGEFEYGYGVTGPTEARGMLLLLNTSVLIFGPYQFTVLDTRVSVFDVIGLLAALGMVFLLLSRAIRNLRTLGALEPPNTPRPRVGE